MMENIEVVNGKINLLDENNKIIRKDIHLLELGDLLFNKKIQVPNEQLNKVIAKLSDDILNGRLIPPVN